MFHSAARRSQRSKRVTAENGEYAEFFIYGDAGNDIPSGMSPRDETSVTYFAIITSMVSSLRCGASSSGSTDGRFVAVSIVVGR